MKRPLFWALVFLILGIFAGRFLINPLNIGLFFLLIIILSILFAFFTKWYGSLFFILITVIGFVNVQTSILPKDNNLEYYVNNQIELKMMGEVKSSSMASNGKQIVNINLETYKYDGTEYETDVNVKGTLPEGVFVNIGQEVGFTGVLKNFDESHVPGGFNEYLYQKSRKLDYKTYPDITYIGDIDNSIAVFLESLRNRFAAVYDICLPEREANIAKSMILGDESGLDEEISELYRQAGIYHIIAISGMHITIIALCLSLILNKFLNKRVSGVITIGFLIFYCALTGFGVATLRATIMCSVVIIGDILNRERDIVTSISFAALCLLIYEPLYIWDVGFQYSFVAVYGLAIGSVAFETILHLLSRGSTKYEKILYSKPIREYFGGSLIATLVTLPIIVYNFYYIYPYSVLINMIIAPTLCITTIVGFLIGILGLFFIEGAIFISGIFYAFVKFYEYLCEFFVSLPYSEILTGSIDYMVIGLIWVVLGALAFALTKNGIYFKKRKKYVFSSFAIFLILIAAWYIYPRNYTTAFLDVGQGDCTVVSDRENTYIIDGGGWLTTDIGKNTGEKILIPYLNYCGINEIDGAFVSHMDSDHVLGIIELFGQKDIENLYISDIEYSDDENYNMLMDLAKEYETDVTTMSTGEVVEGEDIIFECVFPPKDAIGTDRKNYSMVLKMSIGEIDFLFTGDIDTEMEEEMLMSGVDIDAEILKLAHHGSKTSTDKNFLMEVNPVVAVASAGKNNSYGHPSPEVVKRVESLGIILYNTAEDGTVSIKTDGSDIKITKMLGDEKHERFIE